MTAVSLILAVLAFVVAGSTASHAFVAVRSGEHATFTRLVFADPADRGWNIERTAADRVDVTSDGAPPDLDLSRVFDLIPRLRLSNLRVDGGRLRLQLACACQVDVSRISSGHVVIDILDATVDWRPPQPATPRSDAVLPLRLPAADLFFPVLARLAQGQPGPRRPRDTSPQPAPEPHAAAPQVRVLNDRQPRLLQERLPSPLAVVTPPACRLEDLARPILVDDPVEALASLSALSRALLDGEDRLDLTAARALARGYLAAGMGAEATQVQRTTADTSVDMRAIAAAFDAGPRPRDAALDPACGPATTLIALLDADTVDGWDRADHRALVGLMDALPPARWNDVAPRLRAALTSLGGEHLLLGLHPPAMPHAPERPSVAPTVLAAGTDAAAVEAATALLADANARGIAAPEAHIINAMALRRSLPAGDQSRSLDRTLATALVLARHPAEATDMARDGTVSASLILTHALTHLPEAEAAEFAVRLRPLLRGDTDGLRRVDEVLLRLGLETPSDRGGRNPVEPDAAITEVLETPDPWLARDLPALAGAPEAEWTGRNRLARAIVTRNGTGLPTTDLARADRVLGDSRALSALIAGLLSDPAS